MIRYFTTLCLCLGLCLFLLACQPAIQADYIIENGQVFVGDNTPAQSLTVAIKNDKIIYIGESSSHIKSAQIVDAKGLYVLPGFIDPHTHSLSELTHDDASVRRNLNYQFQGVTTVINGNDGFGEPDIAAQIANFETNPIGTNTALFIGHGALRKVVMGGENRAPTDAELTVMKQKIAGAMKAGALGLSTGLFYAPGSFANMDEIIALAREVSTYDGIYDSHIRDESTYNIGLLAAIDEVITIAREADIHAHIAHIKALGVDVWGQSVAIIERVNAARTEGLSVTADQYPWQASGTRISNALLPRWVKAGTVETYQTRLRDPDLLERIKSETAENLRKRGGPEAVLITQKHPDWQGKTLGALAAEYDLAPVDMAIHIAQNGDARIASFNMNPDDIKAFMIQDWVMTSSDGSTGHPRKYASYPKKYHDYVIRQNLMLVETFFYRSSGQVADMLGLCERGYLKVGYAADIAIIDPENFRPLADFHNPENLSEGVTHLFVNGVPTITDGIAQDILPGRALRRCKRS